VVHERVDLGDRRQEIYYRGVNVSIVFFESHFHVTKVTFIL